MCMRLTPCSAAILRIIKNDLDITYTFKRDHGLESFVRVYNQDHHYQVFDKYKWTYPDGTTLAPWPGNYDKFKEFHGSLGRSDLKRTY